MKHKINNTWKENMAFEADVNGFKIILDADEAVGGENRGPKPKSATWSSIIAHAKPALAYPSTARRTFIGLP